MCDNSTVLISINYWTISAMSGIIDLPEPHQVHAL